MKPENRYGIKLTKEKYHDFLKMLAKQPPNKQELDAFLKESVGLMDLDVRSFIVDACIEAVAHHYEKEGFFQKLQTKTLTSCSQVMQYIPGIAACTLLTLATDGFGLVTFFVLPSVNNIVYKASIPSMMGKRRMPPIVIQGGEIQLRDRSEELSYPRN
ncbi:MAG: hypothetical protein FJ161_02455, partial [Gammaproteobacteria bacterium]|nr:hypothetical protein [Gammaproteobacteria bacterium]